MRTLNANSVRFSLRQFQRCSETLPHDCLGVSPIFGGDFCYPVDPQIVSSHLIFDVVDAVFHFSLCAGYLFDISGGVESVALAVGGHLHLVYFSLRVLQAHVKVRDLSYLPHQLVDSLVVCLNE